MKKAYYDFTVRLYSELALQKDVVDSLKVVYLRIANDCQAQSNKLKDSLFNENNSKQIAEISTKFETEKKDHAIVILSNEKNMQQLALKEKQSDLLFSQLQSEKRKSDLNFLQEKKDLQELEMSKMQHSLKIQMLESKTQAASLELGKADKALKDQQLSKERFLKKGLIILSVMLLLFGGLLFNRYKLQKKIENQNALLVERKRISNEIHDDLGAQLSTARMFLNSIKSNDDEKQNYSLVQHSIGIIDSSINDLRNIMDELQSTTLHQKGYISATEELINKINTLGQVVFSLSCNGIEKRLDQKVELQLFRITQELINNSLKYANAKYVSIDLVIRENTIVFLYEDDGKGFDIEKVKHDLEHLIDFAIAYFTRLKEKYGKGRERLGVRRAANPEDQ